MHLLLPPTVSTRIGSRNGSFYICPSRDATASPNPQSSLLPWPRVANFPRSCYSSYASTYSYRFGGDRRGLACYFSSMDVVAALVCHRSSINGCTVFASPLPAVADVYPVSNSVPNPSMWAGQFLQVSAPNTCQQDCSLALPRGAVQHVKCVNQLLSMVYHSRFHGAFCSSFAVLLTHQVDSFLDEERASIDEYDQYLTERSALADRTKIANSSKSANAEKAGARNRGDRD